MAHTPGNWSAHKTTRGWVVETDKPKTRKTVAYIYGNRAATIAKSDAHVIAAAPDTYASLRAMTDWVKAALECKSWNWDGDQREAAEFELAKAVAAIAKAEGK